MKFYRSYSIKHLFFYVYAPELCSHCPPWTPRLNLCPSHDMTLEGERGEGKERPFGIFMGIEVLWPT